MSDDIKKQIFALMAHAEEQQKALDKAIETISKQQEQIGEFQKNLPLLASQLFKNALNDARTSIEGDLSKHGTDISKNMEKASKGALWASQEIKKEVKALGWKHAFMTVGAILGTCMLVILSSILWIPSLDDIAERKATIAKLDKAGGGLQTANCDGKLCVRVMSKQCGYGDTKDYCVLDLKD